ncbi:MAG: 2-hydroxyacid dehydrogenase [Oscillospiraceae bacterium]|nr:2-hydroxyacid dehydrogenase [Oscillospiraceae bacterium]
MRKICLYDAKSYDKIHFEKYKAQFDFSIEYFETKLNPHTAMLAAGRDAVVVFVNDSLNADAIDALFREGIGVAALRCSGYNNVDCEAAAGKLRLARVPDYSPYSVAEHAMALLLTLNRRIHRAYNRTRDYNFSLNGLTGTDLHGKTAGIVGTGKIGGVFADICKGFGMNVCAHDIAPTLPDVEYLSLMDLCRKSDVISLHCPLTPDTYHLINEETIAEVKRGAYLINTSRGALLDSEALLAGIQSRRLGGAALDVYEEESDFFFEDLSDAVVRDDMLTKLISMPNVIVTSHQGFLTEEALDAIAYATCKNLNDYFNGKPMLNEIYAEKKLIGTL